MKTWYNINNKADRTEVTIYDEIGMWGISFQDFINDIKDIDRPIDIHINSPGGSVFDGFAIYDTLNNIRKRQQVHTYVDGMAASMAGVIMLASDRVHVAENARFMMHNVWGGAAGDAEEMRKVADQLDKENEKIVKIFSDKMDKTADEVRQMMNEETWLHGHEIIDAGLADKLIPAKSIKNSFDIKKYNFKNLKIESMNTNEERADLLNKIETMFDKFLNKNKDEKLRDAFAVKIDEMQEQIENFKTDEAKDFDALNEQVTAKDAEIAELKAKVATYESAPANDAPADPDPTKDAPEKVANAFDSIANEMKENKFAN